MPEIVGWDVGGVNTKAIWLPHGEVDRLRSVSWPFEIWRARDQLPAVLQGAFEALSVGQPQAMAVTMTAELSDTFRSKRQGVRFVLTTFRQAFPRVPIYLLSLDREFETLDSALDHPADFCAANWLAGALYVAEHMPDGLMVDMGSTTTDIIPIRKGHVVAQGRTDIERLINGELVYSGVVRTNPNTIVHQVPLRGGVCRVAAEHFAIMADVYLLLGKLQAQDYVCPTPDGRAKTAEDARQRLARLVCADAEDLGSDEIVNLALYLSEKQVQQVSEALAQVLARQSDPRLPVCPSGAGRFVVEEAGRRLGLPVVGLGLSHAVGAVLPCLAVAHLLERQLGGRFK
jgi:probable H4MPT-linked C1 transfer pathway protein